MSLSAFHIFFIAIATLMSLWVGVWGVRGDQTALGVACLAVAVVLTAYGLKVYRKLQALER